MLYFLSSYENIGNVFHRRHIVNFRASSFFLRLVINNKRSYGSDKCSYFLEVLFFWLSVCSGYKLITESTSEYIMILDDSYVCIMLSEACVLKELLAYA